MHTRDELAVVVRSNATRIMVRGPDDLPYETVVFADGTSDVTGWSDPTGAMRISSAPHILVIDTDELPAPDPSLSPRVAIEAGYYLFALNPAGQTVMTKLVDSQPGDPPPNDFFAWQLFDGQPQIRRPINFTWPLGFPEVYVGNAVSRASQAGWIGSTVSGDVEAMAMYWQDFDAKFARGTSFVKTPWTKFPAPWLGLTGDIAGLTMFEPLGGLPTEPPNEPTLWLFARQPDGLLLITPFQQLAPGTVLNWQFFGGPTDGEPALLIMWERFEDTSLFHVVIVTADGRLEARRGGTFPESQRIRPRPSSSRRLSLRPGAAVHAGLRSVIE